MDNEQLDQASDNVELIALNSSENIYRLDLIDEKLSNIDGNIQDLHDHFINNEQDTKENNTKNKQETTADKQEVSETKSSQSEITIETIHEDILSNQALLQDQVNILTISVFSQGILIGVLLLALFWQRYFR